MRVASKKKKSRNSTHLTIDRYMTASPHTIAADQTLATARKLMRLHHIRHLPVLDRGRLVGLLSDRDLKLVESLKGVNEDEVLVDDAMSDEPYAIAPLALLEDAAREMAHRRLGSAVVVDKSQVVGIFTAVDALKALAWLAESRDA